MSGRVKQPVKTSMDMIDIYTAKFSIGNATGTLINSTDMKTTISGTANGSNTGQFLLTLGSDNQYGHLMHFEAGLQAPGGTTGSYRMVPVTGSAVAGTLTVQMLQMVSGSNSVIQGWTAVSGQSAAEIAKAQLTGSVFAVFRNSFRMP